MFELLYIAFIIVCATLFAIGYYYAFMWKAKVYVFEDWGDVLNVKSAKTLYTLKDVIHFGNRSFLLNVPPTFVYKGKKVYMFHENDGKPLYFKPNSSTLDTFKINMLFKNEVIRQMVKATVPTFFSPKTLMYIIIMVAAVFLIIYFAPSFAPALAPAHTTTPVPTLTPVP